MDVPVGGTFVLLWSRHKLITALMIVAVEQRRRGIAGSKWRAALAGRVTASVFVRHPGSRC